MNTKKICAALAATMLLSSAALAAEKNDTPSEINADAIEYDMNTGIVAAAGNILIKYGTLRATGLQAVYNVNSKEAHLIGNVIVIRDDMRMTCNSLTSIGQSYMSADGNVVAVQTVAPDEKYPNGDTRTFTSEHIDYFPDDKKHVVIPKGGVAQSAQEGTFTADQMEGWLDEEHYVGRGNAHLVSTPRKLEAGGDQVDYFGQDAGKAVLSGNAWAIQDNNTIRGNRLTVYMADDGKLKATPDNSQMPEVGKAFDFDKKSSDKPVDEKISDKPVDNKTADNEKSVDEKSSDKQTVTEPEKNSSEGDNHES
ncbi:MAG: organic solvent tolerance protein OstA [Selenomonadaceae bacterium]|nr:organic solvent tolerance protein OstA [Selenomonadaceae bacterium]